MKQCQFIIFVLALISMSCINVYVSSAPVESRTMSFEGSPQAISVSQGVDVVVDATLAPNEAVVTTHNDLIDYVKVYVEDNTLNIGVDAPRSISTERLEVRIPRFAYNALSLSGGADFSDSGYCGEQLTIAASGGADAEIDGAVQMLTASASGGADLSLDELCAACVVVEASGGADVDVYATESLVANASGGADVSYKGNPAKVEANSSSGASIERDND
jgi:hypothetical protein